MQLMGTISAVGILAAAMPSLASEAYGQDLTISSAYDIPSGTLSSALITFSKQSKYVVVAPAEYTSGKTVASVKGTFAAEQVLDKLLNNNGLNYEIRGNNTLVIQEDASRKSSMADYNNMSGANGADNAAEEVSFVLEEIVVTAQKREQNLTDIPASISAFSGQRLEKSGIDNVEDLAQLVAGLHISDNRNQGLVTLRGIGANDRLDPMLESGVAMHLDGVYQAASHLITRSFFDVERIEVLRGPQGTLYGRNATGGAINIITKAPTTEPSMGMKVNFGNYGLVDSEGYMSGPLVGDKVLGRVAARVVNRNGYTPNVETGDTLDDAKYVALRGKLRFELSDDFRLDVTGEYTRDDSRTAGILRRRNDVPVGAETAFGITLPEGRAVAGGAGEMNRVTSWGVKARAEWQVSDGLAFTSLTGYKEMDWRLVIDVDKTSDNIRSWDEFRNFKQFSQELNLSYSGDRLEWLIGASYFTNETLEDAILPLPPIPITFVLGTTPAQNDAYGIFGEVSYDLTDKMTLTLGARYSYEDKGLLAYTGLVFAVPGDAAYEESLINDTNIARFDQAVASNERSASFSAFTPRAALTYDMSDEVTFYATVSRGFKSGNFNAINLDDEASKPEKVTNYEAGVKTSLFEDRLKANFSAFYMDYTDLQVQQVVTIPNGDGTNRSIISIVNAGSAPIKGFEFEWQARPTEALGFDGSLAYFNGKYKDLIIPDSLDGNTEKDVDGNQLVATPEWSLNVGAEYMVPLGDWSATLRGEYNYKSRVHFRAFNDMDLTMPSHGLFNASLAFEQEEGNWIVTVYGKNLGDKEVISHIERDDTYFLAPPLTYGIKLGYSF